MMTRHTPDTLRARASNLALRTAAMAAAQAPAAAAAAAAAPPPATPTLPSPPAAPHVSAAARCYITAGLGAHRSVPVCTRCFADLLESQEANCFPGEQCRVCALLTRRPEEYTRPFCDFLEASPTVFHTVAHFRAQLADAGFAELPARDDWRGRVVPGGRYYTTRNGSSLVAFSVGRAYEPGNGVAMVAGHIDALTARLKPVSRKPARAGYVQLGVAPYAGALNETWWDRDLGIGGRVVVRDEAAGGGGGGQGAKTSVRLVRLGWPVARIPTLAPHFGVGMMGSNNKETEAVPIIGLDGPDATAPLGPEGSFVSTQPPRLVRLVAAELGLRDPAAIVGWELELFDTQPAQVGGLDKEFIFAGRIDDKLCSWAALQALLQADADDDAAGAVKLVALFDDEEIGSLLRQGARGNLLPSVVERTVEALAHHSSTSPSSDGKPKPAYGPGLLGQTYSRSFLVSADVTHAVNPNFLGRYLEDHYPRLNVGLCVAADSNGHMTTDGLSTAVAARVATLAGLAPPQTFMIRNDSRSGGTVGPMLSSAMGVRAVDAGLPQLSMHSVRATTGALDPGLGLEFFRAFLDNWEKIDAEWE